VFLHKSAGAQTSVLRVLIYMKNH